MLELRNIHTYYGNIRAVRGISITVNQGEMVCLIGANGAGKSTTLMTASGIHTPVEGSVHFDGEDITAIQAEERVALGISQVPEGRLIFAEMSVLENLELGAYTRTDKQGIRDDLDRILQFFPVLKNRQKQRGGSLSGGEQQLLSMCRTLMGDPDMVMIDEPTEGLAPKIVEQVGNLLTEIAGRGVSILLVEQKLNIAMRISKRLYIMGHGQVVWEGTPESLQQAGDARAEWLEV